MTKKKNIVHIITELALGGAQKSTLSLIKCLSDKDCYSLFLISSIPKNKAKSFLSDFMQIKQLKIFLFSCLQRKINLPLDLFFILSLVVKLRKIKPYIVHTHSSKAGILGRIAAKLAGTKKIIHTVHGFSFHNYQNIFIKIFYIFIERICAKISTKIIFISLDDFKKAEKYKIGNAAKNVLIRDFIDLQDFISLKEIPSKPTNNKPFTIGTLSCLKKQKGLEYLLDAVKQLKDKHLNINLVICGDGKEKNKLLKTIKKLLLTENVKLLGWQKDIPTIIKTFDVFVLSSLWEGLPISIAESIASGIPVVAPKTNGIPELVKDGETGLLFEVKNSKDLADKIYTIINDEKLSKLLAKKAYNFLMENKEFCLTEATNKLEVLYNNE